MIYVDLSQWSHPKWVCLGITSLKEHTHHFDCVGGDATLYALPRADIVARWQAQTTDALRFCSKSPTTTLHQAALRNCNDLVQGFFMRMPLLELRTGQYWLQLPATFSPCDLPTL